MNQQLFTINPFTTNRDLHILVLSCTEIRLKDAEICFLMVTSTRSLVLSLLQATKLRDSV